MDIWDINGPISPLLNLVCPKFGPPGPSHPRPPPPPETLPLFETNPTISIFVTELEQGITQRRPTFFFPTFFAFKNFSPQFGVFQTKEVFFMFFRFWFFTYFLHCFTKLVHVFFSSKWIQLTIYCQSNCDTQHSHGLCWQSFFVTDVVRMLLQATLRNAVFISLLLGAHCGCVMWVWWQCTALLKG